MGIRHTAKKKKNESSVGKRLKRVTSYNVETIFNEPLDNHSLHPSPPPLSAVGLSLLPNLKKGGGLAGPPFLEGVASKEGGDFFRGEGVAIFQQKIN